jgi:sarcosine oxidase subunit gamma
MAERQSGLTHLATRPRTGGPVTLSKLRPAAVLQVQAWPDALSAAKDVIGELFGNEVPALGHALATDALEIATTGPGRYLIADHAGNLLERFERTLPASVGSVTDLTHGRTMMRLEGKAAAAVLAKCVAIDLDPSAFPAGRIAQTMIHHIDVMLRRRSESSFDLWVLTSFAEALAEWLLDTGWEQEISYPGSRA